MKRIYITKSYLFSHLINSYHLDIINYKSLFSSMVELNTSNIMIQVRILKEIIKISIKKYKIINIIIYYI